MVRRAPRRRAAAEPWFAFGAPESRAWTSRQLAALFVITVVATATRLFRVEEWSWVAEEAVTWQGITDGLAAPFESVHGPTAFHPFVVWLLRWLLDLGVLSARGEGWLRLPFVFVGITAVPLLAVAAKKLVGSAWVALLAAALLAVHPWHVATSQMAAPAGFAGMLGVAAVAALPHGGERSWWRLAVCAVSVLLAIGSHPAGWLTLPLVAVAPVVSRWNAENASPLVTRVLAIVVAAVVPALALRWTDPVWTEVEPGANAWLEFVAAARWPTLLFAGAAFFAVRPLPAGPALMTAAPLASLALASALGVPIARDTFVPLLPMLLVMAAIVGGRAFGVVRSGGVGIGRSGAAAAALLPVALLVSLLVDTALYSTVYRGQRPAWRDARDFALFARQAKRGVAVGAGIGWSSLTFYLRPNHWRGLTADPHPGMRIDRLQLDRPLATLTTFLERSRGEAQVLVLRQDEMSKVEGDPAAKELVARSFVLVDVLATAFHGGTETLYVLREN